MGESLRLSLHQLSLAQGKQPRLSKEPSVRLKNLASHKERIERTKTVCLSWPASSRLRRLKRLQLSIWPNSAKPSRSLKKLKSALSLQWSCKQTTLNYDPSVIFWELK